MDGGPITAPFRSAVRPYGSVPYLKDDCMPATHRFIVLDSLRGLTALAIALVHLPLLGGASASQVMRDSFPLLLFFFVLSGFVLAHAYARQLNTAAAFGHFAIGRTLRIFPLHLSLLALGLVLAIGAGEEARHLDNPLPSLLLLQAWLPGADSQALNPAAWPLSLGYYLWLLFGLALLAVPRGRTGVFAAIVLLAVLALHSGLNELSNSILMGVAAFFLGALCYRLYLAMRLIPLSPAAFTVLEFTTLGVLVLALDAGWELAVVPFHALTLFVFAFEGGALSGLLRLAVFRLLGRWSFSLYLSHILVFMLAGGLAARLAPAAPDAPWLPFAALGGALALAGVAYRCIERPGMALGRRLRTDHGVAATGQVRG